jgi:hypothetical protein
MKAPLGEYIKGYERKNYAVACSCMWIEGPIGSINPL